jgi:stage II sporulation protein AA (anti-sigma F factor antagonist)
MEIRVAKDVEATTVALRGRLDAATSKPTEERLLELIEAGEHRIVMDLAELDYISSVGLRVLILVAKRLKQVQGRVVVCSLQAPIKQVFDIAGFTTLFALYESREQALAGFR